MGAKFILFCVIVCMLGAAVYAEIGNNMNNISQKLMTHLSELREMANVKYSEPIINTTYTASVEFDMRAMGPLYNSTHRVIDVIANKQAYPEGIVSVSDGFIDIASPKDEWRVLLAHYAGPTAVLVVCALLIAALPLAGLFWCCCYWCPVGRRRRPFDRKYDACLKGLLAIILIGLLTLFLFGVVCAFATDSQVESGLSEAPDSVRTGIRDAKEFLNATQAHARWLLVVNYKELADKLKAVLHTSGLAVSMKLSEFSRAVSVTSLNNMVQQLDEVQRDLVNVQHLTAELRRKADELNAGLRKVKNQLLQTLARCNQTKCISLQHKYKIGELDTEIQYSQMPDVSDLLNNVSTVLDSSIKEEVSAGQQVFMNIQTGIRRSVDEHIPEVLTAITETGIQLERMADEITYMAGNASQSLGEQAWTADSLGGLHRRYGPYRRWAGIGAAAALLAVTAMLAWGLMCGVCGKRPDVYGNSDCCNKAQGSRCLLCAMALIFIIGGGVVLVLAAYFAVGVAAQRFICDPLTEPRENRMFADMERFVDLEKALFNERRDPAFNMTSVLLHCHRNLTIYQTLHLRRLFDLDELRVKVGGEVTRRLATLRPQFPREGQGEGRRVTILQEGAKQRLRQLADTGLSDFDFDRILDALETNMTSMALDSLARQLNSTARSLAQPAFQREAADLLRASEALANLIERVLRPMLKDAAALNATALKLRDEIRFKHPTLRAAIEFWLYETNEAEIFLNTKGQERLYNMSQEFGDVIANEINNYLERVISSAYNDVGKCGPLSNAYNATRDAACNKILMPTNGYWMSVAWCVVLFVPLMLVAQRLARLYLHLDPYPGPLVEAELNY